MTQPSSTSTLPSTHVTGLHYLLATAPFVVVFLIMPLELFFNQTEEWDLTLTQLAALPIIGVLCMLVTWLLLAGLGSWRQGIARSIALFLFMLGVYLLLSDLYSPVQIDRLDGTAPTSDEPFKYTALEIGIGVVCLFLFGLLLRGRGERIAGVLAAFLVVIGIGYAGFVAKHMFTPEPEIAKTDAATRSSGGNVYHIVLDRMQTDSFLKSVERADAREAFRGFELFRNNAANYLTTVPSRASYLSSTFYHEGDYKDWFRDVWREQGIQKMLSDQDYRVWNYAPFRQWHDSSVDVFHYLRDLYHERTGIPVSSFSDFVMLWMLRSVPNPLTEEAIAPASLAGDRFLAKLNSLSGAEPVTEDQPERLTVVKGIEVVASKYMFEQLVVDEDLRGNTGEYVYAHAVLPHIPYVLDENCAYYAPTAKPLDHDSRRQAYLDQSTCSIRLIEDFFLRLQALGRYDDATILLHADTGAEEGFLVDPPDYHSASTTLGKPDNQLLSGANALLMIKRPGDSHPLKETDQLTQLVDLYPTLADILDLEGLIDTPIHGRSIEAKGEDQREVRFAFDPDEVTGKNLVEVRIEQPDNLHRSPLTVIGPVAEPINWREEIRLAK
ncbi:MAG: hypothetical protein ACRBM6_24550 [Geminicoccales bacterium]